MGILGKFLRSMVERPAPQIDAITQRIGQVERQADYGNRLAELELRLQCERELRALRSEPHFADPRRLERHGRKVYSQSDEDGIIEEIFRRIGVASRSFVEFGVESGTESNTMKLLLEGWRGLWIEASADQCAHIRRILPGVIQDGRLELQEAFVTVENIDQLIAASSVAATGELDLLSIDIDGNDYYVLRKIEAVKPRVIVIEYNAKFPPPMDLVPPYDPGHLWDGSDYNGSSLQAVTNLATRLGYRLVGTNITGVNAFFVRADLAADKFCADSAAATLYNPPRYWMSAGMFAGHPPGERFHYVSDAAVARESRRE